MINEEKWLRSLAIVKPDLKEAGSGELYSDTIEAIPKKNTYSSIKKYSLVAILFVGGLLFVSAIKNETRSLQREINILHASISEIKFNLNQALLDNEVMTSPENVSRLAKEYLEDDLKTYQKSQIQKLNNREEEKRLIEKHTEKKMSKIPNFGVSYSNYRSVPIKVKTKIVKKIHSTQTEIKKISDSPESIFKSEKAKRWATVQVIKAFLGIPVIPGK